MSADTSILPSELVVTPQPLIGFTGLDINKNTVHRAIWDAFNNNRKNDRAQIQFKLLPNNYEYPVSKPKRQSYEWYHPKGILKRNWMLKHLHVLPGVIVLFQDIEWNDTAWPEKQLHCASLMQSLKNSLQGRNTKLVIVLLQKSAPLPAGEDLMSVERAASLTTKCDISPKMLFVLPHNEHLMGYTLRLESAFLELAQTYYAQMGKKVRMHRDQLTTAHQSLLIRHLFKLGFISEMKFDYNTALKNYSNAYGGLDEIRIIDANSLEMKTVAGFINYKMCKMMFKLNAPRDSITQFKAHIEKYQGRTGFKELLFEHYAWMSVQYSAFAELFCDAIKNGLPALQTQHPGIYYHKAAEYIGKRKEAFLECCSLSSSSPIEPNAPAFTNVFYSDFFGVRGTKLSEPVSETQVIATVQQKEKTFNHSVAIISLLGHAMAQFKIYKCPRFRKKLAVDMAEEYLKSGDHSKALTLYSLMLTDYRIDKWYTVFTEVLLKTLRSAFLSASVADFISCSIESMSPNIHIDTAERIVILENLWKVFQNVPPIAQAQSAPELKSNWEIALTNFKSPILIDLDKVSDLMECTLTFEKPNIKHDESLNLELLIRSKAEIPLKLQEFAVILSDSQYQFKLTAKEYVELKTISNQSNDNVVVDNFNDFMLQPTKCYKIRFHAEQYEFTENSELSIVRLQIIMGSNLHQAILTQSATLNKIKSFKNYNSHIDFMDNIKIHNSCYIIPTYHLVTQNNLANQPMLVNEYFKVQCTVTNPYDLTIQNIGMSVTIPSNLRHKVYITTDLSKQRQKLLSQIQIDLGDLHAQSVSNIVYYVCSLCEGNIELAQKIWYQMDNSQIVCATKSSFIERQLIVESPSHKMPTNTIGSANDRSNNQIKNHNMNIEYLPDGVKKLKDDVVIIPCVEEFQFQGRFYALNRQPLTKAYRNEDFLFRANINVKSECSIDILDMFVICDHNINEKSYSRSRKKLGVPYQKGDKLHDVKLFRAINTTGQWIKRLDFLLQQTSAKQSIVASPTDIFAARRKSTERDQHHTTATGSGVGSGGSVMSMSAAALAKKEDRFKSNLLAKIPINSTIIGSSTNILSSNNQQQLMNRSLTDENKFKNKSSDTLMTSSFHENNAPSVGVGISSDSTVIVKNIYNRSLDSFLLTDHCKGFLKANTGGGINDNLLPPDFGVYCIRWRRTGSTDENESKFIIGGIDIYEPPLNIYCYLDDKMYVKVPMTLRITITNPARTMLRLKTNLRTSENFIFAGNTQLNVSIYANSSYELSYNLYPLKAGWQDLPEFDIKYNTTNNSGTIDIVDGDQHIDDEQNYELQNLVNRWMPKRVFILPMLRVIK